MRKRQLYILSLLSVFCAFGNNCAYGQESSDYGQNGFAYGQQNSAFGQKPSQFPMERLDRGLVALPAAGKGIYLSWRLLGTDSKNVCFDIERDGKVIAHLIRATNFTDVKGSPAHSYRLISYQDEPKMDALMQREVSKPVKPWADLYKSLPINRPEGGTAPDGRVYTYTPNDCSVGDVDGDGEYELIVKWDPSNSHDNSHDGYTGDVILDCYKFDGTQLWRINLGKNIRAGAHYTQFLVFDFDGDGKAEMIARLRLEVSMDRADLLANRLLIQRFVRSIMRLIIATVGDVSRMVRNCSRSSMAKRGRRCIPSGIILTELSMWEDKWLRVNDLRLMAFLLIRLFGAIRTTMATVAKDTSLAWLISMELPIGRVP